MRLTSRPLGPVCFVTSTWPSMSAAALRGIFRRFHQPHAALAGGIVGEMPGAAPAGMDLRFDDVDRTRQFFGDLFGFLRRVGDAAFGNGHAVFLQQAFRLILMDVHVGKTLSRWFRACGPLRHRPEPAKVKIGKAARTAVIPPPPLSATAGAPKP